MIKKKYFNKTLFNIGKIRQINRIFKNRDLLPHEEDFLDGIKMENKSNVNIGSLEQVNNVYYPNRPGPTKLTLKVLNKAEQLLKKGFYNSCYEYIKNIVNFDYYILLYFNLKEYNIVCRIVSLYVRVNISSLVTNRRNDVVAHVSNILLSVINLLEKEKNNFLKRNSYSESYWSTYIDIYFRAIDFYNAIVTFENYYPNKINAQNYKENIFIRNLIENYENIFNLIKNQINNSEILSNKLFNLERFIIYSKFTKVRLGRQIYLDIDEMKNVMFSLDKMCSSDNKYKNFTLKNHAYVNLGTVKMYQELLKGNTIDLSRYIDVLDKKNDIPSIIELKLQDFKQNLINYIHLKNIDYLESCESVLFYTKGWLDNYYKSDIDIESINEFESNNMVLKLFEKYSVLTNYLRVTYNKNKSFDINKIIFYLPLCNFAYSIHYDSLISPEEINHFV